MGTKEMVLELLGFSADTRMTDKLGRTALLWAVHNVNRGPLSMLLKHVLNNGINVAENTGMTPLMWAAHLDR